ncbi:hypothetical protein BAUCODRAFT_29735 [Baudoinia panamericana UAMH 10762]|uniref:Transcriptional regulatory protein RXT2 N-terminal domain-containing protein n=1 Tax=Baudoinia panamericana (strain UAMH 10762) TaxID=717646 RepID=M2MWB9_BAUPA|nr:uncharacterized protein BAUCODRAFT_29735 [Baudoinia panamericana UAMH 10762]EMD01292.1 hypothetical protein BAUCODRAFT_29735 [Baudoinia panamericana UAMH 10762]
MSMTSQQIHIAETIRGMKLALRRNRAASPVDPAGDEDNEDEHDILHTHTNRGNKLRLSAQYVQLGRLDTTGGTRAYKRKINHAGYDRYIISKKPALYDEDGDMIDPADIPADVDVADVAEPLVEDAFGKVKLERLLKPLESAAELPMHPSLSQAYTSPALTEMVRQAEEMVRREKAGLWKAKRLLERFRGDGGFMSGGAFYTERDEAMLDSGEGESAALGDMSAAETELGMTADGHPAEALPPNGDVMDGVEVHDHVGNGASGYEHAVHPSIEQAKERQDQLSTSHHTGEQHANNLHELNILPSTNGGDEEPTPSSAPSHAMTTRHRSARNNNAPASPSPSPSDSASIPPINPWFQFPLTALGDPDLGLPPNEAEETRKLLLLYVQKQENIVRQLETLYSGLQRTDRLRRDVYRACKAEGHTVPDPNGKGVMVTDMSDGEDWYDVRDWGLEVGRDERVKLGPDGVGVLEKGKDEVDDGAEEEGRRVGGRRRRVVGR